MHFVIVVRIPTTIDTKHRIMESLWQSSRYKTPCLGTIKVQKSFRHSLVGSSESENRLLFIHVITIVHCTHARLPVEQLGYLPPRSHPIPNLFLLWFWIVIVSGLTTNAGPGFKSDYANQVFLWAWIPMDGVETSKQTQTTIQSFKGDWVVRILERRSSECRTWTVIAWVSTIDRCWNQFSTLRKSVAKNWSTLERRSFLMICKVFELELFLQYVNMG